MRKYFSTVLLVFLVTSSCWAADVVPFFTKGHTKSMGLNLRIDIPASWKRQEGKRPHVVQLFSTECNNTPVSCLLQIHPGNYKFYEEAQKATVQSMSREDYVGMLPNGSIFLNGTVTKIESETAFFIESTMTKERNHVAIKIHCLHYVIPFRDKMIILMFSTGGLPRDKKCVAVFTKMRPVFLKIANSLVILSKYE